MNNLQIGLKPLYIVRLRYPDLKVGVIHHSEQRALAQNKKFIN